MWIPTLLNGDRVKIVLGLRPLGLNGGKNRIVIPTTTAKRDERDGDVNSFTFSTKPTSKQQQENGINRTKIGRVRELWAVRCSVGILMCCLQKLSRLLEWTWSMKLEHGLSIGKVLATKYIFLLFQYGIPLPNRFFKVSLGVRFLVNVENSQY